MRPVISFTEYIERVKTTGQMVTVNVEVPADFWVTEPISRSTWIQLPKGVRYLLEAYAHYGHYNPETDSIEPTSKEHRTRSDAFELTPILRSVWIQLPKEVRYLLEERAHYSHYNPETDSIEVDQIEFSII